MSTAAKTHPTKSAPKGRSPDKPVEPDAPVPRVIREADFAKRLDQACDAHSLIPPKHSGRQSWIVRELAKRFNVDVSPETARKWFAGEAKPRPDKLAALAQLLEVDVAWLTLGVAPDLDPRERKVRNAMADGAVNLVAGLIQMDGGHPAFPQSGEGHVDLHAIIRGAKYDLHVSLGDEQGKDIRFVVPPTYENLIVLGVVKRGFQIEIFEITPEVIANGERHGGSIEVVVDQVEARLRKIESFRNRL